MLHLGCIPIQTYLEGYKMPIKLIGAYFWVDICRIGPSTVQLGQTEGFCLKLNCKWLACRRDVVHVGAARSTVPHLFLVSWHHPPSSTQASANNLLLCTPHCHPFIATALKHVILTQLSHCLKMPCATSALVPAAQVLDRIQTWVQLYLLKGNI